MSFNSPLTYCFYLECKSIPALIFYIPISHIWAISCFKTGTTSTFKFLKITLYTTLSPDSNTVWMNAMAPPWYILSHWLHFQISCAVYRIHLSVFFPGNFFGPSRPLFCVHVEWSTFPTYSYNFFQPYLLTYTLNHLKVETVLFILCVSTQ